MPRRIIHLLFLAALWGMTAAARLSHSSAQPWPSLTLAAPDEPGERMELNLGLVWRGGHAPSAVRVHAYQADASGRYTLERPMDEPHARLNGWVMLPAGGRFTLRTIRPGGYPRAVRLGDRERHIPAHVHLDVEADGRVLRHWQMVFADDSLLSDPYWRDWVKKLDQPVMKLERAGGIWHGEQQLAVDPERR